MADTTQLNDLNQKSLEEEFIPFFLDNLRNQLTSVLQNFTGYHHVPVKSQPVKLILDQSQFVNNSNFKIESTEPSERVMSELNQSIDLDSTIHQTLNLSNSFNADDSFNLSNSPIRCKKEHVKVNNVTIKKRGTLISSSPSSNKINPAFQIEDQLSFPSLQRSNQSISDVSMDKSATSDLDCSNSLSRNQVLKTPESPLQKNSPYLSCNKSYESYHDTPCMTSTPNNRSHKVSKSFNNSFRSPSQTTLEDYMVKAKKQKPKGKPKNHDQVNSSLQNNESNSIKRKVNPTRLDLNEKGKEENTVFKDIAKPFTQNPQFTNVPTIIKSDEVYPFQDERTLLKEQKEKKIVKPFDESTEEDKSKITVVSKSPSKNVQTNSIVIPDVMLVKNKKVLNQLAKVYSKFLDQNLVVNLMSELYLIINILTTQYKENKKIIDVTIDETIIEGINKLETDVSPDSEKVDGDKSLNELECLKLYDSLIVNLKHMNVEKKKVLENQLNNHKSKENNEKCLSFKEWNTVKSHVKMCLNSPHDCVYFSCEVLNYQKSFLKCLNRPTLKLLSENKNIELFQPELCKYLDTVYHSKVTCDDELKLQVNTGLGKPNVCFQTDEDNLENFTSLSSFQSFKKQRDIFYDILKIWEDNHLKDGWSFKVLKNEINKMLAMDMDATNYKHLTKLFKSQMLNSCLNTGQQEDLLVDGTTDFLRNLKDINSEKLNLLHQKLITPLSQKGPVPLPSFPGVQEFYKDFIVYAAHPVFYTHLENTFIREIIQVNDSQFTSSDIEEAKSEVDEQTKHRFGVCLTSLGILGKFLGFLTSLPYKLSNSMQEDAFDISHRNMCLPRIDLQYCLYNAIIHGRLSLTIPWIVEYFSMLDNASFRLPYYKKILEILYCIYRASCYGTIINLEKSMSQETIFLIKLVIGWLFDLPKFPKKLYYFWQSKYSDKSLKMVYETIQSIIKYERSLAEADKISSMKKDCLFLDKLDLIDDRILFNCCPYLKEFQILLIPGGSRLNTKSKHVTPVTYQLQKSTKKTSIKHLEIELEKSFFNGQPESTKKTVEYVSERVASSCRKHIYKNLLPSEGEKLSKALKNIIKEKNIDVKNGSESVKNLILYDMIQLSDVASKNIRETIQTSLPKYCESHITSSIESLLAQDCLAPVKNMCIKIAVRMTMERVNQWINSRIVEGLIFMKHMESELSKYCKTNDEEITYEICHDSSAASPTEVLDSMRKLISDIMETKGQTLTEESLLIFWEQLHQSLTVRSDSKRTTQKTISNFSVDLCIFVVIYRKDLMTAKVQEKIFATWNLSHLKLREADSPFSRMLCPRNIFLMVQSNNYVVWLNYGSFLKELLKQNFLSISILHDQVDELVKSVVLDYKILAACLNEIIDDYLKQNCMAPPEETEKLNQLLSFVCKYLLS